jgi:hypothetical protein
MIVLIVVYGSIAQVMPSAFYKALQPVVAVDLIVLWSVCQLVSACA